MTRVGFGWEPEFPDYRDYKVGTAPIIWKPAAALAFSLRQHCSPVRNQGQIGSCTGFATCAAIELLRRTDADQHSTIYSPLFSYYYNRIQDGPEWRDVDSGAYIRDSAKVAAKIGIPPESAWKYRPERFAEEPNPTAREEARRWKSGAYYSADTIEEITTAIASGYPVVGGFSCFTNMFTPEVDRTGIIPMPSGKFEGGHAVCFIGYDHNRRLLEAKNSWGEEWGDAGYLWLPYEYVTRRWADDFWVITQESPETRQDRKL